MTNTKLFHFVSAALVTLFGTMAAFDWTSVASEHTAAVIVTALGAGKMVATVVAGKTE